MDKRFSFQDNSGISLLGYGVMRLPLLDNGKTVDTDTSIKLLRSAYEMGINYFDTGYYYLNGQSEAIAAEALKIFPRETYHLAAKMPTWQEGTPKEVDLEKIFEEQLSTFHTDYFDFYLVHALNTAHYSFYEQHNIYEFISKKKKEGRIRRIGFSFHDTPELFSRILEKEWDFAQIQLNYVDWEATDAKTLYRLAEERGIPLVIMEPLRGGALASLSDKAAEVLRQEDPQASIASWGLRYVASLPNVLTVLSGMNTYEQLYDNVETFSPLKPLNGNERVVLDHAASLYVASGVIPCTGCRYCLPCPSGVSIPRVFNIYNHYKTTDNFYNFFNSYHTINADRNASACVECGACLDKCPQKIGIPSHMQNINEVASEIDRLVALDQLG